MTTLALDTYKLLYIQKDFFKKFFPKKQICKTNLGLYLYGNLNINNKYYNTNNDLYKENILQSSLQSSLQSFDKKNKIKSLINEILSQNKYIFELENNWDGENAKIITTDKLEKISNILIDVFSGLTEDYLDFLKNIDVFPGTEGDLHISWTKDNYILGIGIFDDFIIYNYNNIDGANSGGKYELSKIINLIKNNKGY